MKILEKPKLNCNVICENCGCKYVFDVEDIKEEHYQGIIKVEYMSFVLCPICKSAHHIKVGDCYGENKQRI